MIRKTILQALIVAVVLAAASLCHAITMDVTVNGSEVTVKMTATGNPTTTTGRLAVDFGDGSPVEQSPILNWISAKALITNTWITTHTYAQGGTYTLKGSWVSITAPDPFAPLTVIKQVSIMVILPDELPPANVGEEYKALFTAQGGTPPYRFRVVSGSFPANMRVEANGIIRGKPSKLGKYRFNVEARDAKGQKVVQQFELNVGSGEATIRVIPSSQQVSQQGVLTSAVTYEYVGTAVQDVLYSSKGEFRVGSSVLGYVNKGLRLNVKNGKARSSESFRIPQSVISRAEQMKSNKITYTRYFKSRSILGKATCTFILSSKGGELRLTRMRLFFENNRPRIVVARSSRELRASVQINTIGTGLLKGYWEVDDRILQRVQKNVRFGKSITLTTPAVPPLPTYAEGSHRLRFVVTSPDQVIPFPAAYYDVVEQEKSTRNVVTLLDPEDKTVIQADGALFSWQQREEAATYLVSFFDQDSKDEEPVFSAYTKKKSYTLPAQAAEQFFKPGKSYDWLVVGISQEGKIVSESKLWSFSVEAAE